ncbi:DUF1924 domain-containing protein [Tepidimonas sp.]|uniref:DUF1924 domain-containing protein n=1 Tax=Tepidimonas sp. TaxID=2002775 RepID=UPI003FCD091D
MSPISLRPWSRAPGPVLAALACCAWLMTTPAPSLAGDTTPAAELARFQAEAGAPADAARGQRLFTQTHGREWSCASCHGEPPTRAGRHASTGKSIAPLAPAANPEALTERARLDKWFRRNCGEVLGRACTAAEKADVLAYLTRLRP